MKIELLAPAGSMEKFRAALYFGADAFYLGGKQFGLRAQADNFSDEEMREAVALAHAEGKRVFVTVNIFARNADFAQIDAFLTQLEAARVDGVIVSDLGIMDLVLSKHADLELHVSTQANTMNTASAKFYERLGAKRIVLARELSIREISEIRQALGETTELESFIHGAMCISYSGRCLLSNYLSDRESNRGACVQACRWQYTVTETSRSGRQLPIEEDARGTYIMNSKDLNMLKHLDLLASAGIGSFKIEGRTKTAYYVAAVVNAYRRAIDALAQGGAYRPDPMLVEELNRTGNRDFTTGFYLGQEAQSVNLAESRPHQTYDFCASVIDYDAARGAALVEMRNRFWTGLTLNVLSPHDSLNREFVVGHMETEKGEPLNDAFRVQQRLWLKTDFALHAGDMLRKVSAARVPEKL